MKEDKYVSLLNLYVNSSFHFGYYFSLIYIYKKNNWNEKTENNQVIVTLPKIYILIGSIDILFFCICIFLSIYKSNGTATLWVWIIFGVFILLGVTIIWVTLIWKIHIFRNKNYFIYRTVFGKTMKVQYNECKEYTLKENTLVLKTNKKRLYIDMFAKNSDIFLLMLRHNNVKNK